MEEEQYNIMSVCFRCIHAEDRNVERNNNET